MTPSPVLKWYCGKSENGNGFEQIEICFERFHFPSLLF